MTIQVSVCEQCGEVYDHTGYPICPDCQYDHTFIQIKEQAKEPNKVTNEHTI